jgi:hypothetical protein
MSTSAATAESTSSTTGPKIRPLPGSPVVRKSARQVVELEGQNHRPKIGVKWKYSVEATDRTGHELAGNVLTRFLYRGVVIGTEAPARHKLKRGKLSDTLSFPPPSVGLPLSVQVVVTTRFGSLKLKWPVTPVSR